MWPGYEKPWEVLTQFGFVLGGKRQSFNTSRLVISTRLSVFRFHLFVGQNFGSYGGGRLTDCVWEGNKSSFPGSKRGRCKASCRNHKSWNELRGSSVGALPETPATTLSRLSRNSKCGLLENFMIIFRETETFRRKTSCSQSSTESNEQEKRSNKLHKNMELHVSQRRDKSAASSIEPSLCAPLELANGGKVPASTAEQSKKYIFEWKRRGCWIVGTFYCFIIMIRQQQRDEFEFVMKRRLTPSALYVPRAN